MNAYDVSVIKEIEDEAVALGSTITDAQAGSFRFVMTLIVMGIAILGGLLYAYFTICKKYRVRYAELLQKNDKNRKDFPPSSWNLLRMKDLLQKTEAELVQSML